MYFEQAIQLDPEYALPYAELALIYGRQAFLGITPTRDGVKRQVELAGKALSLDESLPRSALESRSGRKDDEGSGRV
jgi:hypothetical protein